MEGGGGVERDEQEKLRQARSFNDNVGYDGEKRRKKEDDAMATSVFLDFMIGIV